MKFNLNPFRKLVTGAALLAATSGQAAEKPSMSVNEKMAGELHAEQTTTPEKVRELATVLSTKYGPKVEVSNFTDATRSFEELQNAYVYIEVDKKTNGEVKCIDTNKDGNVDEAIYKDAHEAARHVVFDGTDYNMTHLKDNAQELFTKGTFLILKSKESESKKGPELAQK